MTPLPLITALARAGALEQALRLFDAGGYNERSDDPAALAVKGRLLKDRALLVRAAGASDTKASHAATGGERGALLAQAAEAYGAAHALDPQPWLLINVATLAFLAGDTAKARGVAGEVLEWLEKPGLAETPYWIAATRAEALLLRGNLTGADEALGKAIRLNREGWSDHASTLRQLGLICAAAGVEVGWLDRHRPRPSLHYAGHLGIDPDDCAGLVDEVTIRLAEERVGFGYGALAAGADIIIAEALIAKGAALHVILPTLVEDFIEQSVTPYGAAWRQRFDACIAAAASVRAVTSLSGEYEPLATALAGDVAMGAARRNAAMLQSHALQLLIIDEGEGDYGRGTSTARDGVVWARSGATQHKIVWPRNAAVPPSAGRSEGRADRRLLALVHAWFDGLDDLAETGFATALDGGLTAFWTKARGQGAIVDQPHGHGRLFGFVSLAAAANFAQGLRAADPRIGAALTLSAHYGLVHLIGGEVSGPAVSTLLAISAATMAGSVTVSDEFAATLLLTRSDSRIQPIGECPRPQGESGTIYGLSFGT